MYSGTHSRQVRQVGLNTADAHSPALAISMRKYQLPISSRTLHGDGKGRSTVSAYCSPLGVHLESTSSRSPRLIHMSGGGLTVTG